MKKIQFVDSLEGIEADVLIVRDAHVQKDLDIQLKGVVSFNLKKFPLPMSMTTNGAYPIPQIVFVDEEEDLTRFANANSVAIAIDESAIEKSAFELLKKAPLADLLIFLCKDPENTQVRFQKYQHLLQGISLAKEVISEPANRMPPQEVAKKCQQLEKQGVLVEVLDHEKLDAIGAHALLAVGRGSSNPPKMVIMEWKGSVNPPIALVGKGICYDAGGINLKTTHLLEMKWDKAGAGAVIGVMDVLSRLKMPVHVVGIVVLAENMPDGNAFKPGDIISSLGGKSLEIIDTDCEGRLALADGIAYAQKYHFPKTVIDLGTLTLETFGALGYEYAGLFCNDATLTQELVKAGLSTNEKLWQLPLGKYYADQLISKVADLKNVGVFRYGASSAAAEFLHAFVMPHVAWAHIDIAGTAWKLDAPEEGVSAFGVELLIEYISRCM